MLLLIHFTSVVKKTKTLSSSAVSCSGSSPPGCSPHSRGSPQHHRGLWGQSTFTHRGKHQMKLHTDLLNLHLQQVVSDVAVSERTHILLCLIYKVSLSRVWTCDSSEGEKCGILPALRSSQLMRMEEIRGSGYKGEDSTIKK